MSAALITGPAGLIGSGLQAFPRESRVWNEMRSYFRKRADRRHAAKLEKTLPALPASDGQPITILGFRTLYECD